MYVLGSASKISKCAKSIYSEITSTGIMDLKYIIKMSLG